MDGPLQFRFLIIYLSPSNCICQSFFIPHPSFLFSRTTINQTILTRNKTKMAFHCHAIMLMLMMLSILTFAFALDINNSSSSHPLSSPTRRIHDLLKSNGLPIGLFPNAISDFSIDRATGRFELHLLPPSPCDAKFETRIRYQWNITGTLSYGKISDMSGVAAEELFLWLPVKGIQVDIPSSGLIYFDVGVVYKQFSLSFFETPKDCNGLGNSGDDFVFFDGFGQILENQGKKLVLEHVTDEEPRADS